MKRKLIIALLAASLCMSTTVTSFAATSNHTTKDLTVASGAEITGAEAPFLVIEKSEDHGSNFSFELDLINAEWLYEGQGDIETGVSYIVLTSRKMMINVDTTLFSAKTTDLRIPLYTRVIEGGSATVSIDAKSSSVTPGTYTFAHVNYPGMTVVVYDIEKNTGEISLHFKDGHAYSMPASKLYKMTVDNGFVFTGKGSVEATGKYKGIIEFAVDEKEQEVAYIKETAVSPMSVGEIKVVGIQLAATDKTVLTRSTNIKIEPVYGEASAITIILGVISDPIEAQTDGKDDTEDSNKGKAIKFDIGGNYYVIDNSEMIPIDAAPYVDYNGRTMLPVRALANAFDIDDEDIKWDAETKKATITNEAGEKLVITVGNNVLKVGASQITMDTVAVVKDGRVYLPMRAVLNALGVKDDAITWNSQEKSVTVDYK